MIVDIVGWILVAGLFALFIVQSLNIRNYARPQKSDGTLPPLSILVPARNEERSIGECVSSLLAQEYPGSLEVVVLDDGSTDRTREILTQLTLTSSRLRVIAGESLPSDWNGKVWACHQLSRSAAGAWMLFTDADTIHAPDAAARSVAEAIARNAGLLSLMPRQITLTIAERLTIPLLNFFYLTFFPGFMLERSSDPKFAAANGQFMLFRREAYDRIGGHESVRSTVIDDLSLAKEIRRASQRLVIGDGNELVSCRMYHDRNEIVRGFSKNLYAAVGASAPRAIGISGMLLLLFVGPPILLVTTTSFPALIATLLGIWLRVRTALRTGEEMFYSLLHPISILIAVAMLLRSTWAGVRGERVTWKDRPTLPG